MASGLHWAVSFCNRARFSGLFPLTNFLPTLPSPSTYFPVPVPSLSCSSFILPPRMPPAGSRRRPYGTRKVWHALLKCVIRTIAQVQLCTIAHVNVQRCTITLAKCAYCTIPKLHIAQLQFWGRDERPDNVTSEATAHL